MGAPLAPVLTEIFLSPLEETLMDRLVQFGACEWYRIVGDTFELMCSCLIIVDDIDRLDVALESSLVCAGRRPRFLLVHICTCELLSALI